MKEVEKEQLEAADLERQKQAAKELVWARARRDLLLMQHPTNWAGFSLLQVPHSTRRNYMPPRRYNTFDGIARVSCTWYTVSAYSSDQLHKVFRRQPLISGKATAVPFCSVQSVTN